MSKNPLRKIRVVFRRSPLLVKCVVATALLLSIVALITLRMTIVETQTKTEQLRQEAAALEQENEALEKNIAILDTVEGIRRIATEILGLVDPNTLFLQPESTEDPADIPIDIPVDIP